MQIQPREEIHVTYPYPHHQAIEKPITLNVKLYVGIDAETARRLVNIQLMLKFGQLVITEEPELYIDKQDIYWKVPLRVVSPDGDDNRYFLQQCALVDAITGHSNMDEQFLTELRAEARPLLRRLYPDVRRKGNYNVNLARIESGLSACSKNTGKRRTLAEQCQPVLLCRLLRRDKQIGGAESEFRAWLEQSRS